MTTRALVLGGGGPVGIAWETGLVAGLEEEGVVLAEADLIVGTSAGSVVGAQLALGRSPREMLATQLSLDQRDRPELRALRQPIDMTEMLERWAKLYTSERPPEEVRAELGAYALQSQTMSEEDWLATFGQLIAAQNWPERRFVCTAVDTANGAFVTWDNDAGVSLGHAVASSCAVPGVFPSVTINGRRYMDGGVRSTTNADLAQGYDRVLVVAVKANAGDLPIQRQMAELRRQRVERELQTLRDAGATVQLIEPDDAALEAFGPNLMDATRRRAAAEAGHRQGRIEAERLRAFWQGR